ncbi:MAG: PEP-utilizing enzyme [Candidatus Micrarchaeota archaeon]
MNTQNALVSLFGSQARARLLETLFAGGKARGVSELAQDANVDVGAAHRELANLVNTGIATVDDGSGKPLYEVNDANAFHEGLKLLFTATRLRKPIFRLEEILDGTPIICYSYQHLPWVNTALAEANLQCRLSRTVSAYDEKHFELWYETREYRDLEEEVVAKILEDPDWAIADSQNIISLARRLNRLSNEMAERDYANISNAQLADCFEEYYAAYQQAHTPGWVQNLVDLPDMLLSKRLLELLKQRARERGLNGNPVEAFCKLTTPLEQSSMAVEYEELLEILGDTNANPKARELFRTLEARHILEKISGTHAGNAIALHAKKHGWLGHGYLDSDWNAEVFTDRLASLCRQGVDATKAIVEEREKTRELERQQARLEKEFNLDERERKLFQAARGFVHAKGFRKDAMIRSFSRTEPLYKEIAKRKFVSTLDVRFCFPCEVRKLLEGKLDVALLGRRREYGFMESTLEGDTLLEGDEARKRFAEYALEEREETEVTELNGMCACPGKHRGKVKIINAAEDMTKMRQGDVLASLATMPELMPAMKKAGAIVTDMGGLTCHAAIVSRELGVPCVVGTRNATKLLKDGWLVDVDATHGTVKVIEKNA